jgi:uncharacterized protein
MNRTIFHLAFPVNDIERTKIFYVEGLGCEAGRETADALILNLYGHQLVAHRTPEPLAPQRGIYPRHFGLVFTQAADWDSLRSRAEAQHLPFYQQPKQRFLNLPLEHRTFFLQDPFYNLLEFKVYRYAKAIFGGQEHAIIGDRD